MIRILIIEGQPPVRKDLHELLTAENDLAVLDEVATYDTAIDVLKKNCPDVVLINANISDTEGLIVASDAHQICPRSLIIIMSMHEDALILARVREAGAATFVSKSLPTDALLAAIREFADAPVMR
jgi:DNA-binding NarL/FixJ family response regulator